MAVPVAESERPPPDKRVLEAFARRRRRDIWMLAIAVAYLCAAGVLMLIFLFQSTKDLWGLWMAIGAGWMAFLVVGGIFYVRNWRCPACDKFLGEMVDPTYCGWCGVKIPEERRYRWWCESCGELTRRTLNLRFCPWCGVQLQRVSVEE
jgi:predicted RNA-binding Zn-ribbon protein involved in translation (DUF1610 family)